MLFPDTHLKTSSGLIKEKHRFEMKEGMHSHHAEHGWSIGPGQDAPRPSPWCPHTPRLAPSLGSAPRKIDGREAPSTRAPLGEAFHNCCFHTVRANYTINCVSSYLLPLIAAERMMLATEKQLPKRGPGVRHGLSGPSGKFWAENQFPCNYRPDNSKRHSGFYSK